MPRLGEQLLAVASRGVSAKRLAPASGSARWPPWESVASGASRAIFPPGLLSGTEAAIWAAMSAVGHEQLVAPRPGKQAAVRAALKAAGLGWVATNTIPYRIAVGKLFDLARGLALQSGRRAFRPRNATGKRQRDGRDRASPRTALQGQPSSWLLHPP